MIRNVTSGSKLRNHRSELPGAEEHTHACTYARSTQQRQSQGAAGQDPAGPHAARGTSRVAAGAAAALPERDESAGALRRTSCRTWTSHDASHMVQNTGHRAEAPQGPSVGWRAGAATSRGRAGAVLTALPVGWRWRPPGAGRAGPRLRAGQAVRTALRAKMSPLKRGRGSECGRLELWCCCSAVRTTCRCLRVWVAGATSHCRLYCQ